MKVKGKHYTAIWPDRENGGSINVIDQKKLPFRFEIVSLSDFKSCCDAICDMTVRGAPLIGITAAYSLYIASCESEKSADPLHEISEKADTLKKTRPTAVNLNHATDYMLDKLTHLTPGQALKEEAFRAAGKYFENEVECCKAIGQAGLPLIEEISRKKNGKTVNILTHCNAGWLACGDYGTATAPIYLAHDKGIKVHVWVDETRPRNQGSKLTAWELGMHGVPHTVIPDNTGGYLMQHGMVDIVIVGSDRTTRNGDVANKIGTYLKALAAKDNNIPFYVALPTSTIDMNISCGLTETPIEERSQDEVRYIEGQTENRIVRISIMPDESPAVNYGFDVTPARLVSGLITELGIFAAKETEICRMFKIKQKSNRPGNDLSSKLS